MEDWEHCGPQSCGHKYAPPEVYSNAPGDVGFVPGMEMIAVRVDGVYRGTALAYNVGSGWAEIETPEGRTRLTGVIKPEWV